MGKQKLIKGKPKRGLARTEYGEKKINVNLSLTPTAIAHLISAADKLGISRSEFAERLLRRGETWLTEAVTKPFDVEAHFDFIFDDWRQSSDHQSIYGSSIDVENDLSIGQFHSGTTYRGALLMDKWARDELTKHIKKGFTPVFYCDEVFVQSED